MRWALLACMGGGLSLAAALSAARAEKSPSREVESQDMGEIKRYSDQIGRAWLKDSLGLDLDALALEFDPRDLSFRKPSRSRSAASFASGSANGSGAPAVAAGPAASVSSYLSLKLEQKDDLRRLQNDLRDIPFGLSVSGQLPILANLTQLETRLWVPFSWRDEFRAQAQVPFLDRRLTLRSDYRNQLGLSKVEAGLGTQLRPEGMGVWGLDYDFQRSFGQGTDAAIHWLKLSKSF